MSFHAGQSFTFGETPSATKWNYLWENDYALQDWTAFTNDTFPIALIADGDITAAKLDADAIGHGFIEIGRTTLGVAGDSITVASLPAFKFLKIMFLVIPTGGTISAGYQFNGDTGNNYTYRTSLNNGADTATGSAARAYPHSSTSAFQILNVMHVTNVAASEKIGIGQSVESAAAGAANVANKIEASIKWANTSAQISQVSIGNAGTGDYAIGSTLAVFGKN